MKLRLRFALSAPLIVALGGNWAVLQQSCGWLDLSGIVFSLALALVQGATILFFVPYRIVIGAATMMAILRVRFIVFATGADASASGGFLGWFSPLLLATAFIVLVGAALLWAVQFLVQAITPDFNFTSSSRIVAVGLGVLTLVYFMGPMVRFYDSLRDTIGRAAYTQSFNFIQAAGVDLTGVGGVSVPTSCGLDCSGLKFALGYLNIASSAELAGDDIPIGFRAKYYSLPPANTEITPDVVATWSCQKMPEMWQLLWSGWRGLGVLFVGYVVAAFACMEELIWLLFSIATIVVFLMMALSLLPAVFTTTSSPFGVILNVAVTLMFAAVIAGVVMGLTMGLLLLATVSDFAFNGMIFLATLIYSAILKQTTDLVGQTFRSLGATVVNFAPKMDIAQATQAVATAAGQESDAKALEDLLPFKRGFEGAEKGARMGRFAGPVGMLVGGFTGGALGAAITPELAETGKRVVSGATTGASMGTIAGPEGALVGAIGGATLGAVMGQEDQRDFREVAHTAQMGIMLSRRMRHVGDLVAGGQARDNAADESSHADVATLDTAETSAPAGAPTAGAQPRNAPNKTTDSKAVPTGTEAPEAAPVADSLNLTVNVAPPIEADLDGIVAEAYQRETPAEAWPEAQRGYGGVVNQVVQTAREHNVPPEVLSTTLRALMEGDEAAARQALQSGAPALETAETDALIQSATPLAKWVKRTNEAARLDARAQARRGPNARRLTPADRAQAAAVAPDSWPAPLPMPEAAPALPETVRPPAIDPTPARRLAPHTAATSPVVPPSASELAALRAQGLPEWMLNDPFFTDGPLSKLRQSSAPSAEPVSAASPSISLAAQSDVAAASNEQVMQDNGRAERPSEELLTPPASLNASSSTPNLSGLEQIAAENGWEMPTIDDYVKSRLTPDAPVADSRRNAQQFSPADIDQAATLAPSAVQKLPDWIPPVTPAKPADGIAPRPDKPAGKDPNPARRFAAADIAQAAATKSSVASPNAVSDTPRLVVEDLAPQPPVTPSRAMPNASRTEPTYAETLDDLSRITAELEAQFQLNQGER